MSSRRPAKDYSQAPALRTLWTKAVAASDFGRAEKREGDKAGRLSTTKAVAWAIGSYMNARAEAFPSRGTIARATGVGVRTVDRCITEIEAAGLLMVFPGGGRGRSNRYVGTIPEELWSIWPEDFVARMVGLGILGEDANGDTGDALYTETATRGTRNGDTGTRNGDLGSRNGDIATAPEVDLEVDEGEVPEASEHSRPRRILHDLDEEEERDDEQLQEQNEDEIILTAVLDETTAEVGA